MDVEKGNGRATNTRPHTHSPTICMDILLLAGLLSVVVGVNRRISPSSFPPNRTESTQQTSLVTLLPQAKDGRGRGRGGGRKRDRPNTSSYKIQTGSMREYIVCLKCKGSALTLRRVLFNKTSENNVSDFFSRCCCTLLALLVLFSSIFI